jgi:hypothetical protein
MQTGSADRDQRRKPAAVSALIWVTLVGIALISATIGELWYVFD